MRVSHKQNRGIRYNHCKNDLRERKGTEIGLEPSYVRLSYRFFALISILSVPIESSWL